MNRKCFLQGLLSAGTGLMCCGAALRATSLTDSERNSSREPAEPAQGWIAGLERRTVEGARTPDWRRVGFAEEWARRLMNGMDETLDPETRKRLMQAHGRGCYVEAWGVRAERPRPPFDMERLKEQIQKSGSKDVWVEGETIFFQYGPTHANPYGISVGDGYCLCPLVESLKGRLSSTYCLCSTGYVKEGWERALGVPLDVEVVESVRMSAKRCLFRLRVLKG